MSSSIEFMRLALVQAALVVDENYPYPGVGVVVVRDGKVLARGHNSPPGSGKPHAEVQVFTELKTRNEEINGTVLYTNLEPCSNDNGLVPACSKAIIDAGIKEVHIAVRDPYHMVRDQGVRHLESGGVKVIYGELEEEARWQNRKYFARFCPHCGWPTVDGKQEVGQL